MAINPNYANNDSKKLTQPNINNKIDVIGTRKSEMRS